MIDFDVPEIGVALETVESGVALGLEVRRAVAHDALQKEDRSPVTVADFSIQALVARRLQQAFPRVPLVAEERSDELRQPGHAAVCRQVLEWVSRFVDPGGREEVFGWIDHGASDPARRFWTLDPIDGTKGFLRGGHWAVCLALLEDHQVRLGVLGCPHWSAEVGWQAQGPGGLVLAVRGEGCWWRPLGGDEPLRPLQASGRDRPEDARILRSYESGHTNEEQMERLVEEIGARADPVLMDSQAKYAALAAGQGDVLVRLLRPDKTGYKEKIWDQAAGSLVIQEAGGQVTDLDGRALDFSTGRKLLNNRGILASNGRLHQACLQALQALQVA
ncbi:MAG TPA: inositol monophosphatase family protein [Acidobacteriota bacterium]|nr:inositol monophosphatase family protein [Acidobacteriota bacterium]